MWQLIATVVGGWSFRAWSLGTGGAGETTKKNSSSVASVEGGAQEGFHATAILGHPKSLWIEVHSQARADHITLLNVPDIQLRALPYNSAT